MFRKKKKKEKKTRLFIEFFFSEISYILLDLYPIIFTSEKIPGKFFSDENLSKNFNSKNFRFFWPKIISNLYIYNVIFFIYFFLFLFFLFTATTTLFFFVDFNFLSISKILIYALNFKNKLTAFK